MSAGPRTRLLLIALAVGAGRLGAQGPTPTPTPAPRADFPLSAYAAFGSSFGERAQLGSLGWTEAQFNAFVEGVRAAYQGKPVAMDAVGKAFMEETSRRIAAAAAARQAATPPPEAERLSRFMQLARKTLGLQIADSGLGYNVQAGRNGIRPRPGDTIVFSCAATAPDGSQLTQLSAAHIRSRMDGMLPGLAEGLQMMTVGSQAIFVLPPDLSFGTGAWPDGVARGSPLIYRIQLEDVIPAAR